MAWTSDVFAVMRGLEKVAQAIATHQQAECSRIWLNSSVRSVVHDACNQMEDRFSDVLVRPDVVKGNLSNVIEKASSAIKENVQSKAAQVAEKMRNPGEQIFSFAAATGSPSSTVSDETSPSKASTSNPFTSKIINVAMPSSILGVDVGPVVKADNLTRTRDILSKVVSPTKKPLDDHISAMSSSRRTKHHGSISKPVRLTLTQKLNEKSRESKVPGSRIGRLMSFGSLAAGLGFGALAEVTRRGFGVKNEDKLFRAVGTNPFLTEANVERIVNTLCRVRGAALKLGQMISIQDDSFISPELKMIFDRVRQSADFMPTWQMERVIESELGPGWKDQLQTFDNKPFAAASIGQVHRGVLLDGRPVAMKIQYPGVAASIDSDINNLMTVLNVWKILPDGLYAEKAMEVARKELRYECDYEREAKASKQFRELLKDDPVFYVPEVIESLSKKRVLTTELVSGVTLEKLTSEDQDTRSWVCENLMRLCLLELFVFHIMQTDPNWSNFLYDSKTDRISLLDFGATRAYSRRFTDDYIRIIMAASVGDRQAVLEGSRKLGFLTGYESKVMEKAHVDAVMLLGRPFASDVPFDFGHQMTAKGIQELIPVLLKHRLVPPPEETYSLHRKLSGAFLLSTKLSAVMSMKHLFYEIYNEFEFDREDDPTPF